MCLFAPRCDCECAHIHAKSARLFAVRGAETSLCWFANRCCCCASPTNRETARDLNFTIITSLFWLDSTCGTFSANWAAHTKVSPPQAPPHSARTLLHFVTKPNGTGFKYLDFSRWLLSTTWKLFQKICLLKSKLAWIFLDLAMQD